MEYGPRPYFLIKKNLADKHMFARFPSSFAIILIGKRELSLSSWCLVIFVWLFLEVPLVCLQFVIVVFPDHTHLLFLMKFQL